VLRLEDPRTAQAAAVHDADGALDVTTALRKLRYETRLAVVLRYYLDLPFDEVASVSNCTLEAARSRVRRGLAALAGTLAGTEVST
jgi:DNA-directed RNA polymerase specialized sigma24 family protein